MTPEHQRLRQLTLSLFAMLLIMAAAFVGMVVKYHLLDGQFDRLETAHLQVYSAYETCDDERWAP